jgi:hypothetical protein
MHKKNEGNGEMSEGLDEEEKEGTKIPDAGSKVYDIQHVYEVVAQRRGR